MIIFLFLAAYILILAVAVGMLFFALYTFVIVPSRGSVFAPTRERQIVAAFNFADAKPGELLVDLGSGDGKVLIAAAERGIRARGVELNPFFVWYSRYRIWRRGLGHLAIVVRGDMFVHSVADADVIFLYLVPLSMERLAVRLRREAVSGTRIVTNLFPLPLWEAQQKQDKIFLYRA